MDSDVYALGAPNGHSHYKAPSAFYEPPPATPAGHGSMNYSPRHSHKPASLSNSRNIHMKHLSLNISPTNISTSPAKKTKPPALAIPPSEVTPTRPCRVEGIQDRDGGLEEKNGSDKSRGKDSDFTQNFKDFRNARTGDSKNYRTTSDSRTSDFASDFPHDFASDFSRNFSRGNSTSGDSTKGAMSPPALPPWRATIGKGHDRLQSPFGPSSLRYTPETSVAERLGAVDLIDDSEISKPGIFPEDHLNGATYSKRHLSEPSSGAVSQHLNYKVEKNPPKPLSGSPSKSVHSDSSRHESYTFTIPEELQESSMVYAYPEGPANALNSTLYLFSDPHTSDFKIDINDYDLVVNVAKECVDLSSSFDSENGRKKYLWVPWSHTSKISQDLPEITKLIAAMDQPGKKILVHCQCGVSRSACVVVAYFMTKFGLSVNEAYELLKSGTRNSPHSFVQQVSGSGNVVEACDRICPNMSLIFELMDFGEKLKENESSS